MGSGGHRAPGPPPRIKPVDHMPLRNRSISAAMNRWNASATAAGSSFHPPQRQPGLIEALIFCPVEFNHRAHLPLTRSSHALGASRQARRRFATIGIFITRRARLLTFQAAREERPAI